MDDNFVEILNRHRALIYKICNLYCTDQEDRKDLFQEIVIQIWRSMASFRRESLRSTWIYRIALNTAITHFKKEKRTITAVSLSGIEIPDIVGEDNEQLLQQLMHAIEQLDKLDKSVMLLYLEAKSYEEISEITGLSKSNIGVKINRIKTKLSAVLIK
jgi:RNA polymerase sigma factor (sigma-70 family)